MKMKTLIGFLTIALSSISVFAANPSLTQIYFKPYPADGEPNHPGKKCGSTNTTREWIHRDLGDGVKVEIGIHEKGKQISATLLFTHADGKLEFSTDEFKLHVFPNEKIYKPIEVRRNIYQASSECSEQYGEWVYLKFSVQPEDVEQIALVIPLDAIIKDKRNRIRVRPFRFDKVDESANGTSKPTMTPIKIQGSNPSY